MCISVSESEGEKKRTGQRRMAPPRLTGALRSFSSVSKKEDLTDQFYDLKVRSDTTYVKIKSH